MNGRSIAGRASLILTLITGGPAVAGDIEYGAYLAQDCTSCHQNNSESVGIPKIDGLSMEYFISALEAYTEGHRDHSTMRMIARSLDAEQIAALAAYYAQK